MAKKLKWNNEEIVAEYAVKDSHGADIDVSNLRAVAEGKNKSMVIAGNAEPPKETDPGYIVVSYRKGSNGEFFSDYADFAAYVSGGEIRNDAFLDTENDTISPFPSGIYSNDYIIIKGFGVNEAQSSAPCRGVVCKCSDLISKTSFAATKVGDVALIIETEVPDWWVSDTNAQNTFLTFSKMETSKVDLSTVVNTTGDQEIGGIKTFTGEHTVLQTLWFPGANNLITSTYNRTGTAKNYDMLMKANGSFIFMSPIEPRNAGGVNVGTTSYYFNAFSATKMNFVYNSSKYFTVACDSSNKLTISWNGGATHFSINDSSHEIRWVGNLTLAGSYALDCYQISYSGESINTSKIISQCDLNTETDTTNTSFSGIANDQVDYVFTSPLSSITVSEFHSETAQPSWSFQFVAGTNFSISLPSGTVWPDGTPTFVQGREYRVIVYKGVSANSYKAHLIED